MRDAGQEARRSEERSTSEDEEEGAKRAESSDEIQKVTPRVNPPWQAKDAASCNIVGKLVQSVKEDDTEELVAQTPKKRPGRKPKQSAEAKKTGASKAKTKAKRVQQETARRRT